jgi:hypothetical protein
MDMQNRTKYDDIKGAWKVIHKGKELDKEFKTSKEAHDHLQTLIGKK